MVRTALAVHRPLVFDAAITDPQFSSAKRQQRTNAFTSSMAHASLERQLLQVRSEKIELEAKLRERDSTIEQLEGDRRLLALREQSEREEKEQEHSARAKEKVLPLPNYRTCHLISCPLATVIITCRNTEATQFFAQARGRQVKFG